MKEKLSKQAVEQAQGAKCAKVPAFAQLIFVNCERTIVFWDQTRKFNISFSEWPHNSAWKSGRGIRNSRFVCSPLVIDSDYHLLSLHFGWTGIRALLVKWRVFISDYISAEAAKILRLLHIRDLRELQTQINLAIVKVQALIANPKTDTKLGKVGIGK